MGRSARGVRGIRLRSGDKVVGMDLVDETRNLLVMSGNGYGKMTRIANFPAHKRGGMGIKAAVVTAKTGSIIDVRAIDADVGEIIAISAGGQTIRVAVKDIPTLGRATQGVRIMKLRDDDSVASVGLIPEQTKELSDDEKPLENPKTPDETVVKSTTKKGDENDAHGHS